MGEGTSTQIHKQTDTQIHKYKTLKCRNTYGIYAEMQITGLQKYKFQKLELPVPVSLIFLLFYFLI